VTQLFRNQSLIFSLKKTYLKYMISKTSSKVAAFAAAIAVVAAVAIAPLAHAQTTSTTTTSSTSTAALQAEIASLQAQLAASQGTMTAPAMTTPTFTTDLTIGSSGSMVTALQTWLIAKGYSIPAGATGYFGTQTQAAVAAYQAASGITPDSGYFGPITRAKVNAAGSMTTTTTTTTTSTVPGCAAGAMYSSTTGAACGTTTTTTTGATTTTGPLSGGEGAVDNFQTVGPTSVTIGTGANQEIMGFQFQAGGSDLAVSRIYYDFYNASGYGTTRPWNIFNTATITDGTGKVIATIDASNQANYSEDGTTSDGTQIYRLDFENINQTVKEGTTVDYYLNLTTDSAFSSGNVVTGTQYDIGLAGQGLRATDAMGIQEYSTTNPTYSTVNINNNTSGSLTLSTGSDNPQTTTIMGNLNTSTQGVVLNTFTLQNTGQSSVEVYTIPVTVSTSISGGTAGVTSVSSDLIQDIKLYNGSTLLDTESPSSSFVSGGTLNFKNINLIIPAGTTDSFSIQADIQPIGSTDSAGSGSSVTVSVPGTGTDIETAGGSLVPPSGASTGYPISFAVNGLSVASSPTSATAVATLANGSNSTQTGTFTFVFNVTAFGQTIYVGSTSAAYQLQIIDSTAATTTTAYTSALTSSSNRSGDGNFQVNSGQTATFTVTASLTGGSSHFYYAVLKSLVYGTTDAAASTSSVTLPSNYTTNAVSISS
jgi:peptidoglycan hydrolase-like protein with peptidoglycan-binding domain